MKTLSHLSYWLVLVLGFSVTLGGCSSALKKKCESTNWFSYGEEVAKKGQRTSSDTFIAACEKEDVPINHAALSQGFQKGLNEYCTAEFAFQLGRRGDFLASDMCSGGQELLMKPKHAAGVLEYCQPENALVAGATGKPYNQICPKLLEPAFLVEFNKGRKKFLSGIVIQKEGEIQDLEQEIRTLESQRNISNHEVQRLESDRIALSHRSTHQNHLQATGQQAPGTVDLISQTAQQIETDLSNARARMSQLDREIREKRNHQSARRKEVRAAQAELLSLN